MSTPLWLTESAAPVNSVLDGQLPSVSTRPAVLHEAMRYSCLDGGKRLRAVMAKMACASVGGDADKANGLAGALEMIHAYSLIHDDLPCMDDDDFRRGKPSNHKVFGEGIAVLAGDALLTQAFVELSSMPQNYGVDASTTVQVINEVSKACGSLGLVGGQVVDLVSEGKTIDADTLEYIHQHKTGKLFVTALRCGGMIGGASEEQLVALTEYGEQFGLAFQITDDILDIEGDQAILGKAIGADARQNKATFPSIYGLDKAKAMAKECAAKCHEALACLPTNSAALRELALFILERDH